MADVALLHGTIYFFGTEGAGVVAKRFELAVGGTGSQGFYFSQWAGSGLVWRREKLAFHAETGSCFVQPLAGG